MGKKSIKLAADIPLTVSRPTLLENGDDSDFRTLVHNLLALSSRLESIRSDFGNLIGLSGIQYTVLISIAHLQEERGVGVKTIASHLSLSGAFATIEIGKLLKLGLVKKQTNPDDKRRVLVTVTTKGKKLLADLAPFQQQVNDSLFESLNAKEFQELLRLSRGLLNGAEKAVNLANHMANIKNLDL